MSRDRAHAQDTARRPGHARHDSGGAWLVDSIERLQTLEPARARGRDADAGSSDAYARASDGASGGIDASGFRERDASAGAASPSGTGATGVLLAYFESLACFDEWVAVSNLWERREHAGMSDYLCARLYREASDAGLEWYMSQIVTMWITRRGAGAIANGDRGGCEAQGESLERMLLMSCRRSLRLATKICWLLAASAADSGDERAVLAFRDKCATEAVDHGTWPPPFEERVMRTSSSDRLLLTSPSKGARSSGSLEHASDPETLPRRGFGAVRSPARQQRTNEDDKRVAESSPSSTGFFSGVSRALSFISSPSGSRKESVKKLKDQKEKVPTKEPPRAAGGLSTLFSVCGKLDLPPEDGAKALRLRKKTFEATMKLTDDLCELSLSLSKVFPLEDRQKILRHELAQLNKRFRHTDKGTGVLFPMGHGEMERVIRIPWEEAVLLNSREKAPYLVCLEVVNSNPTQEEMHNPSSSMDSLGGLDVEDFYPAADDMPVTNFRDRIRRSLERELSGEAQHWRRESDDDSQTTQDSNEGLLGVILTVDERHEKISVTIIAAKERFDPIEATQSPHQRKPSDVAIIEMAARMRGARLSQDRTESDEALLPTVSGVGAAMTSSPHKRSAGGLGEAWKDKRERIRQSSPYGHLPGWGLKPIIIKAGDNCRQELLALQLVRTFAEIYRNAGVRCWIRDFDILTTNSHSALIEAVTDAPSIHALKSRSPRGTTLRQHFERKFGVGTPEFRKAQNNFVESLAGYSILTYLLQVKDRHNGNILLHENGHLIHIDFNFMLSTSPGGINFESSPFKLTKEYLEVMDSDIEGTRSDAFDAYKALCIQGYFAVREHAERIVLLVQMMGASGCPCFNAGPKVIKQLRRRFNLHQNEEQCVETVLEMISDSMDAWSTRQYDFYQRILNGIL